MEHIEIGSGWMSIELITKKARSEGGNRWAKKLFAKDAKDSNRWGHSASKEL